MRDLRPNPDGVYETLPPDSQPSDRLLHGASMTPLLMLDDADRRAILELGRCHFRQGRFSDARRVFELSASLEPSSALAWLLLGLVHDRVRELTTAAECFGRSARLARDEARSELELDALLLAASVEIRADRRVVASRHLGLAATVQADSDRVLTRSAWPRLLSMAIGLPLTKSWAARDIAGPIDRLTPPIPFHHRWATLFRLSRAQLKHLTRTMLLKSQDLELSRRLNDLARSGERPELLWAIASNHEQTGLSLEGELVGRRHRSSKARARARTSKPTLAQKRAADVLYEIRKAYLHSETSVLAQTMGPTLLEPIHQAPEGFTRELALAERTRNVIVLWPKISETLLLGPPISLGSLAAMLASVDRPISAQES